jgi:hypothetical protein
LKTDWRKRCQRYGDPMRNQGKGSHQKPDTTIGQGRAAVGRRLETPVHRLDFMAVCFIMVTFIVSYHL